MKKITLIFLLSCSLTFGARKDYGGWAYNKETKCNLRQEILIERAVEVISITGECKIEGEGRWIDFYTNEILTSEAQIDIDHLLPVDYYDKNCKKEEATKKDMRKFYNDKQNLVITSRTTNRVKGNKAKDEYAKTIKDVGRRAEYEKTWDLIYSVYCS